jgi:hypothetical protein
MHLLPPLASVRASVVYVWKCLGCGTVNRRDPKHVSTAGVCSCGCYCQKANMRKEVAK